MKRFFDRAPLLLEEFREVLKQLREGRRSDLPKKFGLVFILIAGALVLVLNTWAYTDKVVNNTISAWMTYLWRLNAGVPFFIGGVIGHWCSRDFDLPKSLAMTFVFFAVTLCLLLVDVIFDSILARHPAVIWVAIGFPVGFLFWQMYEVAT